MDLRAKWKFYPNLRKSPSPKSEGLHFELKIWICCQSHEFYHFLMTNGCFGKLRTWGIKSNNILRLLYDLINRTKPRTTKEFYKNRFILNIFQV